MKTILRKMTLDIARELVNCTYDEERDNLDIDTKIKKVAAQIESQYGSELYDILNDLAWSFWFEKGIAE